MIPPRECMCLDGKCHKELYSGHNTICKKDAKATESAAPSGQAELPGCATKPSEEVESLRYTIRLALHWLQEYKNDSDNATHAKRVLANAKYAFDGK